MLKLSCGQNNPRGVPPNYLLVITGIQVVITNLDLTEHLWAAPKKARVNKKAHKLDSAPPVL